MLIEENPFPANMLQHEAESATSSKDDSSTKTVDRPTEETVYPIKVEPVPANNVVIKVGDVECNAGGRNSHLRTYRPKADVINGE